MSAGLHVVLSYFPGTTTLVAELYNQENIPNSALPIPFVVVGTYRFYANDVLIAEINGTDRVELVITAPLCSSNYRVDAIYTADAIIQPLTTALITVGSDYIFGRYIRSATIPGGEQLFLAPPVGVVPDNIIWSGNYQVLVPQPIDPLTIIAMGNGIYEVSFRDTVSGYLYYSTFEATMSSETSYVRLVGSDGELYGSNGAPQTAGRLNIEPIDAQAPYRYRNYVNGVLYNDFSSINLAILNANDRLDFFVIDCCGVVLTANTFVVGCSIITPIVRSIARRATFRGCGCGK
jgi:hypothetical protein